MTLTTPSVNVSISACTRRASRSVADNRGGTATCPIQSTAQLCDSPFRLPVLPATLHVATDVHAYGLLTPPPRMPYDIPIHISPRSVGRIGD